MEAGGAMVSEAVQLSEAIEKHGIIFVLSLACFFLGFLFWQERKENKALYAMILENGKEMTAVAIGVQATVAGMKEAIQAVLGTVARRPSRRGPDEE